jgi:hypothetical protein
MLRFLSVSRLALNTNLILEIGSNIFINDYPMKRLSLKRGVCRIDLFKGVNSGKFTL